MVRIVVLKKFKTYYRAEGILNSDGYGGKDETP